MHALSIIKTLLGVLQYQINMIKEDKLLSIQLKIGLRCLKDELQTMTKRVEEYDEFQLQELAYDIEDFTDGLWVPKSFGSVLSAIGMNPKDEHVQLINDFKERMKNLEKHPPKSSELASSGTTSSTAGAAGSPYTPNVNLVGIDTPLDVLLELLSPLPSEKHQLRVISIVGCHGIGKTALARAVYNDPRVSEAFNCTAWVQASECSHVGELLDKVLEAVTTKDSPSATLDDILKHKRYLVFIDDVQRAPAEAWVNTVDAFPKNNNSSRIIVTTSVGSVAAACSSGSYVYRMQCLGEADSKNLFWRTVYGRPMEPVDALVNGSKSIFSKCNGLPLALISVAKHLSTKGGREREFLESKDCETAGHTVSAFGEMRRALMQSYDSLPDHDHKTCLLYLSVFPRGHHIKSKCFIRMLTAEGLMIDKDSHKCFQELIDRCIVEQVQSCSKSRDVKRGQVHGVVLEYITEQAVSKNLVTLIHEHDNLPIVNRGVARVRRLSIQSCVQKEYCGVEDKSAIRSLILFNGRHFEFSSCKMLRLMDLEGCNDLGQRLLDDICELQFLKYLSLRKTNVTKLPRDIEKLNHLETLDIRETPVSLDLPLDVIMLPKLAHLLGKFKLTGVPRDTKKLRDFLSNRSQLHTFAGLHIGDKEGIEGVVILHAKNLKKVKVWYDATPPHPAPGTSSASSPVTRSTPSLTLSQTHARNRRYSFMQYFSCFSKGEDPVPSSDPNPPKLYAYHQSKHAASTTTSIHAPAPAPSILSMDAPKNVNNIDLISSLEARCYALESVSICSNQLCRDFLVSVLKLHCTISSVKLQGQLRCLPDSSILEQGHLHCNLNRLQLVSTGLSIEDLSALQRLRSLEYLKLVEDDPAGFQGSNFIVQREGFQSLKRLCLQAPKLPNLQFHDGAMTSLISLHLISPESSLVDVTRQTVAGISHAANINEVVLHYSATKATQDYWKSVVQEHPNRPCVKKEPEPMANASA